MKKVSILIITVLSIVLFFLFFRNVNFEEIKAKIADVNLWWVLIGGISFVIAHIFRSLRWLLLLRQIKPEIHARNTFLAMVISYGSNIIIPHAGVVTRASFLKRKSGVPMVENIGTFFAEKIVDSVIVVSLTLLMVATDLPKLFSTQTSDIFQSLGEIVLWVLAGLLLYQLLVWALPNALVSKYKAYLFDFFQKIKTGISTIKSTGHVLRFGLLTGFTWVFYFGTFYALFIGFTTEVSPLDAVYIAAVGNISWIFPTQAGLGAFHIAVSETMKMKGFDESMSNFSSLFLHGSIVFYDLVFGLLAYVYSFFIPDFQEVGADDGIGG